MRALLVFTPVLLYGLVAATTAQTQFREFPKHLPPDTDRTNALALGDVDGDGDLDLVLANDFKQTRLYLNDGRGTFIDGTASRMPPDSDDTSDVALGDVDSDGDLDIVLANALQQNRLYLNDGTGTYADATATHVPVDTYWTESIALADVDADGDLDMVLGNWYEQNRLYLNGGSGTFADATATHMPGDADPTDALGLGDVDGDGDLDIVIGNSGQNRLYLNDGTGTYADATSARIPMDNALTHDIALGDVDGDGDLDIVLGNTFWFPPPGATNQLYLNDGTGTYSDVTGTRMPIDNDMTHSVAMGDVDGDGDLDLTFGNYGYFGSYIQTRLYLNDGKGVYTDVTIPRLPIDTDTTTSLALGDLDGDRDLDLIVGNWGQNRLYSNLLRQIDVLSPVVLGGTYQIDVYARYGPPRQTDEAGIFIASGTAQIPLIPFGTFGLDPAQTLALPAIPIPQPAGVTSVSFSIPNAPNLLGVALYGQALVIQRPTQARLTNVAASVVQ